MDTPYKNAEAQRDAAKAKITKLEQQLNAARADYDLAVAFIEGWERFAEMKPRSSGVTPVDNPAKEYVAEATVDILRDTGHPLNRTQLYEALAEKGIEIKGKDPKVVLSTMLWRQKEVVTFHEGVGYWPAGEAIPTSVTPERVMPERIAGSGYGFGGGTAPALPTTSRPRTESFAADLDDEIPF